MKHRIDPFIFIRDLSDEQLTQLRQVLERDAAAAAVYRHWQAVHEALAREIGTVDSDVFLLFVLYESGRASVLSEAERRRVERAAPVIRRALDRSGGLSVISSDIEAAAEAFEAAWDDWFGEDAPDRHAPPREPLRRAVRRGGRSAGAPSSRRRAGRSSSSRWVVRAGIGASIVVFSVLLLLLGRREFGGVTVETASGEVRIVELGDGSTVRMLGGSRLAYVPPEEASFIDRQAEFEGQGYFEIASDDRGFVLKTPNAQAVVLGTSFGVQADAEVTEVVLAAGRLTLSARRAPDRAVVLSSGQMSRVGSEGGPSTPIDISLYDRLSWTGLFVFQSVRIDDLIAELSRFYGAEISAEEELHGEQITGRFEQEQGLEQILDVVAVAIDAHVERLDGGRYLLERR